MSEPTPEPGWLAVTDVARVLDANERTARRWVTRHSTYIRTRRDGRLYLVAADAMSVLRRIRDLYAEGRTAAQVDMALAAEGAVATLDASKAPDTPEEDVRELQRLVVTLADAVAAVREEAAVAQERTDRQTAVLTAAVEGLRAEVAAMREEQARRRSWWPWGWR